MAGVERSMIGPFVLQIRKALLLEAFRAGGTGGMIRTSNVMNSFGQEKPTESRTI